MASICTRMKHGPFFFFLAKPRRLMSMLLLQPFCFF